MILSRPQTARTIDKHGTTGVGTSLRLQPHCVLSASLLSFLFADPFLTPSTPSTSLCSSCSTPTMTSTKLQTHHPLPAPAILSVPHSKSHVLAGVQDAYWSDEEAGPRLFLFSLVFLTRSCVLRKTRSALSVLRRWIYLISILSPVSAGIRCDRFLPSQNVLSPRRTDLSLLLAPYQREFEQALPCVPPRLYR